MDEVPIQAVHRKRFRVIFTDWRNGGGLTLEEALQVAYADDLDVGDIYIEPPEPAELMDEGSADEDGGGLVDNLSANQLRAAAEISIYQQDNTDDNEIISEALEEPEEEPQPVNSVEKIDYSNISWINGDIVCNEKQFPQKNWDFLLG
ncbi:hypothetical protein JTB14_035565 [Gonioctena quinquepunctata]|nr:hypothetical protein JTB14_035565 [Gonioctena quinquepunctata]